MSEGEEDLTPNSATPLPSKDLDLDQDEEWTDELVDFADRLEPFTEFSFLVHDLPVVSGLLDYFKLFFPDSVLNMISGKPTDMRSNSKKQREQRMCTGSHPLLLI
ncbi:hypothetical protein RRG08_003151 [Elysia crispata]|uniref:Uncharacterized protein n=1 Tax=Elysia crispata TaxID=231223 RepID=A0AAE1EAX6_9GAST|nr:hypothetical protein RRG08_003151 [Elysia crispata]